MTDIYQTPGDRLRFEIILKALVEDGTNLAVLSEHDLVLDYYASLIDQRLRDMGQDQVEFCFSTNSEKLVQKFNDILSQLTIDQALEKDRKHVPRRYMIFRDSILMQDFELQLLARLVNGFPAGNICVILLINSMGSNRDKLDAFGRTLLQWEVETVAGEPKRPLEDWVAEPEPEAEPADPAALLQAVKPSWRIPEAGAEAAAPAATIPGDTDARVEPVMTSTETPLAPPASTTLHLPPKKPFPWGWLFAGVFILSVAFLATLYADTLEEEFEAFRKYLLRGTPAAATAVDPIAPAASQAASEAAEPVAQASDAAADPATVASAPAALSAPAGETASAATPAVAQVPLAPPASPPPVVVSSRDARETPPPPSPPPAQERAKEDRLTDETWIEQLPAEGFVVQLAAFDSLDEIVAFQRTDPVLQKARVLRLRKKDSGKRYFVLIAGPWSDKAKAEAGMQTHPLLARGWLRSVKSLKAQL